MKNLLVLALIILVSAISFSQNINVTFQVDMGIAIFEGTFPAGANVVVRGDFQVDAGDPGGNWQGNLFQLSDSDNDSIYTGTFPIPANFSGNNYNFNYVIVNPPANDNWETDPNRQFTLTSPSTVIPLDCFNHDCLISFSEVTNTIKFTADISSILGVGIDGAFDPMQDSLLVMGLDWNNLGKNVVGRRRMINEDINPGIYTTTLTVTSGSAAPNGVGDTTKWKFKAYPDSRFIIGGWEFGADRWHIYEQDGAIIELPVIVPRIYPSFAASTTEIDFTINVDMTGAINVYNGESIPVDLIQYVVLKGSEPWLGGYFTPYGNCWCPDDTTNDLLKVLTHTSGNVWSLNTTLPIGTTCGPFEFRFGAMYPGADTVNGGIAYLNNEFPFDVNHTEYLSPSRSVVIYNTRFGDPFRIDNVKQVENLIPDKYILYQNYPNPFSAKGESTSGGNSATKIRYSIPEYSFVTLKVFNLLGEEIETLVNGEQQAGVYEAAFNASDLPSGIYFYSLQAKYFTSSKKMILIK